MHDQRNNKAAFLSPRERRTVKAFAEVFIEGSGIVISPEEITQNIDDYLRQTRSNRLRSLRLLLFIIEYVMPRLSLWPFRPSFSNMTPAARKGFIEQKISNPRNRGPLRDFAKIKSLFAVGYYGDPRVYGSINFIPVAQRPKYQPDKLKRLPMPNIKLTTPSPALSCDVCVIGSGAGGAVVAYHAAAAGKDVLLLEEGNYVSSEEMVHNEAVMMPRLYKESGLQMTVDLDLTILQGRSLGGSTTLNNAICLRLNDSHLVATADTLAAWRQLGANIDRTRLDAAYERVEHVLSVRPLLETQEPGIPPIDGNNARVLLDGWAAVATKYPDLAGQHKSGLVFKNYHRCLGCGYCNFGCPYERKLAMAETYIPRAIECGARIVTGCHAVKIETKGSRAAAVRCELADGSSVVVKARSIVVAAGAIGSSVLLMKSGIYGNVGRRFSFNAGLPVFALFPQRLQGFDGVQMAAYVDGGDYLIESLFYPPMAFAAPLPGWFNDHFRRMQAYDRFAGAGVLVGTESNGRVKRLSLSRRLFGPVAYRMTPGDMAKLKRGVARTAQAFFAAGAERVYPATFADVELDAGRFAANPGAILPFLDEHIRQPEDMTLGTAHPLGGNAMSDDPSIGVVDSHLRVHGYDNLFVCDGSVFPTTTRVNPQLTIMALADYFVHLGVL